MKLKYISFTIKKINHVFDKKTPCNLEQIKENCKSIESEVWKEAMRLKPKLKICAEYKECHKTEYYIKLCLPRQQKAYCHVVTIEQ